MPAGQASRPRIQGEKANINPEHYLGSLSGYATVAMCPIYDNVFSILKENDLVLSVEL